MAGEFHRQTFQHLQGLATIGTEERGGGGAAAVKRLQTPAPSSSSAGEIDTRTPVPPLTWPSGTEGTAEVALPLSQLSLSHLFLPCMHRAWSGLGCVTLTTSGHYLTFWLWINNATVACRRLGLIGLEGAWHHNRESSCTDSPYLGKSILQSPHQPSLFLSSSCQQHC